MIRLLLIDDHAVVREGVKRILANVSDIEVACEAATAQETAEALATESYDAVLLDISLPDGNGFTVLQHLTATYPHLPVVIFSVHPERQYVVRALQAGAAGYLTKNSAPKELVAALRQVTQGETYISATLVGHLVTEVTERDALLHPRLTERETQVLQRLAAGSTMKEIAYELSLSVKTVSTYRTRLLKKLRLHTTADLIRYAIRQGLVE